MATQEQVQVFINKLSSLARAEYLKRDKWVLPSVCIAQAALETGWGTSSLMTKANAYFGIKATGWGGKVFNTRTKECYDGRTYTEINDCFRAYNSLADSVADYYDLICGSPRYASAVCNPNAQNTISAIKAGGYATDPTYVEKIMSIINKYNLTQYDVRTAVPTTQKKSIDEIAREVIAGKWNDGKLRQSRLEEAGYNYAEVQNRVNEIVGVKTTPTPAQQIKVGDKIKIRQGATQYGSKFGFASFVYKETYTVTQIKGNRVVFGKGVATTGATDISNCIKC